MKEPWIAPNNWDYEGRWARVMPPPFGSDDWKREQRRLDAELEASIQQSNRHFWWMLFYVALFLILFS